jgi:hypothetical protein
LNSSSDTFDSDGDDDNEWLLFCNTDSNFQPKDTYEVVSETDEVLRTKNPVETLVA